MIKMFRIKIPFVFKSSRIGIINMKIFEMQVPKNLDNIFHLWFVNKITLDNNKNDNIHKS